MSISSNLPWHHDHSFSQDKIQKGERRTRLVLMITLMMMVIEIASGIAFGSIALLADGLHMGSHATALGINAFAYFYARRHAHNPRFTFGTGKVNALGGFAGAILLGGFALTMAWSSFERLMTPVPITFDWAIGVAVVGLIVNGVSVFLLGDEHHHHDHDHHHADDELDHHHDYNLRSAYLHVLADALTSILAIVALLFGKYFGWIWMDPMMGVLGAILVVRWSISLMKETSVHLLDEAAPSQIRNALQMAIEKDGDAHVYDLHVWCVAPGHYAAIVGLASKDPLPADLYKERVPKRLGIAHLTIEIQKMNDNHVVA